jgi:twitching motility two-component system response regulator PilH
MTIREKPMRERSAAPQNARFMARILIVDDSSFQRRLLRAMVTQLGHEVSEASCGSSGLAAVAADSPDVVLLDLLMPGLTGFEMLERLKEANSQIPRIVLTADVQDSAREQCLELGALRVLHKPPKQGDLALALDAALGDPESLR